jgi:hypothetical protein
MPPQIELNLALILFIPWFSILAGLFWLFPRQSRGWRRRVFDLASLALAIGAAVAGTHWGMLHADPAAAAIWKQVLATSVGYGMFLLVLAVAIVARRLVLRAGPSARHLPSRVRCP